MIKAYLNEIAVLHQLHCISLRSNHKLNVKSRYPVRDDLIVSTDVKGKQPQPLPEARTALALPEDLLNDTIKVWDFLNNFRYMHSLSRQLRKSQTMLSLFSKVQFPNLICRHLLPSVVPAK